jgi:flagellar biosynthesis protein FliR
MMMDGTYYDPDVMGAAWTGIAAALPDATMLFCILFARLGGILMLLPAFSDDAVPGRIRIMIALAITAGLYPILHASVAPALPDMKASDIGFARLILTEMVLGIALGMIVRIFFHAIVIAGGIISLQVGLTSAMVFDPSAGGQVPVMSKFISITALLLCMAMGVHHLWIGAMMHSYVNFAVGAIAPSGDFAALALRSVTGAMALGLSLAAPLIVYGIVFNVALGLAARLAPALQIFFIAQPLNLLLGLMLTSAALAASLNGFAGKMSEWTLAVWG